MHRFKNILFVPLAKTANPAAVRRVADLAQRNQAQLTVSGVVAKPSSLHRLLDRPRIDPRVLEAEQQALVERLRACCRDIGQPTAEPAVAVGDVPLVIIEQVLAGDHDLVVVTSDEDREDRAAVKRLMRKCPCPVWVIRPSRARIQRVLAAVNPSPDELDLNRQILEIASSMVERYGGEAHVVHAWEFPGEASMRSSAFLHPAEGEVDQLVEAERLRHREALDLLIGQYGGGADWTVHLRKGRPADIVSDVVTKKRINLLVMGTVARTGVAGLLVGNTAERLLDEVRCSVITLKPPGFVSPVVGHP